MELLQQNDIFNVCDGDDGKGLVLQKCQPPPVTPAKTPESVVVQVLFVLCQCHSNPFFTIFFISFFQEPPRANNNNKATPDLSADATEAFDGTETVVRIAGEDDPFPLWLLNGNKIDISCR